MRHLFIVAMLIVAAESSARGMSSRYAQLGRAPSSTSETSFGNVVEKKLDGLDQDPQRASIMLFAKELPAAHGRGEALSGLAKTCAKAEFKDLCSQIDVNTQSKKSSSTKKSKPHVALKDSDLPELNKLTLGEVTSVFGRYSPEKALPFASGLIEKKECQSTSLYTAAGAHFEDKFPDPKYVDMTFALYEKSAACGKDESAVRASYRLGLMKIWKGHCKDAVKSLKGVTPDKAWSSLHSRAEYWISVCSSKDRLPAAVAKEQVYERFSQFPLSFHSIVFSLQQEDELFKVVKSNTDPRVSFRTAKDSGNLNTLIAAVEAVLREDKFEYARYWMEFTDPDKTVGLEPEFRLYTGLLYHKTLLSLHKFKVFSQLFSEDVKYKSIATLKVMYPLWKFDIVDNATKSTDPLLVLSLIRQESAFQENAQSRVGARGLMQIMPKTAKALHGKKLKPNELYDPELNVRLGTKYVDKLLQKYDGNVYKVLAAYNAGGLRVDEWTKRYPTSNDILFMDMIPYRETREYVASILRNYYWYSKLYPDLSKKQVVFWNQPSVYTN